MDARRITYGKRETASTARCPIAVEKRSRYLIVAGVARLFVSTTISIEKFKAMPFNQKHGYAQGKIVAQRAE
jgi:hypothetical protein